MTSTMFLLPHMWLARGQRGWGGEATPGQYVLPGSEMKIILLPRNKDSAYLRNIPLFLEIRLGQHFFSIKKKKKSVHSLV